MKPIVVSVAVDGAAADILWSVVDMLDVELDVFMAWRSGFTMEGAAAIRTLGVALGMTTGNYIQLCKPNLTLNYTQAT